jgi:hypothetical protein
MSINLFDSLTMTAAINRQLPLPTFLRNMFFSATESHYSEYVQTDIERGGEKMAALVLKNASAENVDVSGYETQIYRPAVIKERKTTTAEQALTRQAGQSIYRDINMQQYAAQRLGEDLLDLRNRAERRIAYMCSQALTTGTVVTLEDAAGGAIETIDYGMPAAHKSDLASGDYWSVNGKKPLDNLLEWSEMVARASTLSLNAIVFGLDAWISFRNNSQISGMDSLFDKTKIQLGQINPSSMGRGVMYLGYLLEVGCDAYLCTESVVNNAGTRIELMPKNKVLMGSTDARSIVHFGLIRDLEAPKPDPNKPPPPPFFAKSWMEHDPSGRVVMAQSSPLPVLHEPDAFLCKRVVA